jgi:SIR2-like domain/NACHT domain
MQCDLFKRLKKEYRHRTNPYVVIVGTGLSISATNNQEVASWAGLIRSGIKFCKDHQLVTGKWQKIRFMQLNGNDISEMLTASEHITEKLGGRAGREYRDWLKETVGELENKIVRFDLATAIAHLDATILTTNYDGILEKVTELPAITWQDRFELDDVLRGRGGSRIIHLHGYWKKPESVILGLRSYDEILCDGAAQQALRNFLGTSTVIFIGTAVSGGLSDPNFDALRRWIISNCSHTALHYVFVREAEIENARKQLPLQGRILPIGYEDHWHLPGMIEELAALRPSRISVRTAQQATAIETYLEHVRSFCRRLPNEDTHRSRLGKTLDELYVPAQLRIPAKLDLQASKESVDECPPCDSPSGPAMDVCEAFTWATKSGHRHIAIEGEPGMGKSTLLRHLARLAWDRPEAIGLPVRHLPLLIRAKGLPGDMRYPEARLQAASETVGAKLPEGFLHNWSKKAEAPWLFLFDGLDEIPDAPLNDQRNEVVNLLFDLLLDDSPGAPRCVISSRPGCDLSFADLFSQCIRYEILALSPSAQAALAMKLVGSENADFLRLFDSLRFGSAGNTPLLTTLAAQIYLDSGRLPRSRAQLYEQYISSCINVDQRAALFNEVDPRLWKYGDLVRPILERLALRLTSGTAHAQSSSAIEAVAAEIIEVLGETPASARLIASHLMGVLIRRTGLLREVAGEIEWSHQTLREYLAACALKRAPLEEIREAVSKWEQDTWAEIVVFLLIRGGAKSSVRLLPASELLDGILSTKRTDYKAYLYAANVIAEGATVSDGVKDRVVEGVKSVAIRGGQLDYCQSVYADWSKTGKSPTDLLRRMLPNATAERALLDLIRADVEMWQKENAIRACIDGGIVQPLLEMLKSSDLNQNLRELLRSIVSDSGRQRRKKKAIQGAINA